MAKINKMRLDEVHEELRRLESVKDTSSTRYHQVCRRRQELEDREINKMSPDELRKEWERLRRSGNRLSTRYDQVLRRRRELENSVKS